MKAIIGQKIAKFDGKNWSSKDCTVRQKLKAFPPQWKEPHLYSSSVNQEEYCVASVNKKKWKELVAQKEPTADEPNCWV